MIWIKCAMWEMNDNSNGKGKTFTGEKLMAQDGVFAQVVLTTPQLHAYNQLQYNQCLLRINLPNI